MKETVIATVVLLSALIACPVKGEVLSELHMDKLWAGQGVQLTENGGQVCARVDPGGNPWDRAIGINDLRLKVGRSYRLSLKAFSDKSSKFPIVIQRAASPWTIQAQFPGSASRTGELLSGDFEASDKESGQVVFQLGGSTEAWTLCIAGLSFREVPPSASRVATQAALYRLPPVVNQLGYVAGGPMRATIFSPNAGRVPFTVESADGRVVKHGLALPAGFDRTAGAQVQVADFSDLKGVGRGYRIVAEGRASASFTLGEPVYGGLARDALSWFYTQRSGVAIDGDVAGVQYARPAGHLQAGPNKGDRDVACLTGKDAVDLYGNWQCGYRLDVTGGWYDAGDQGKYVVSGSIAAAQLLAAYERAIAYDGPRSPITHDGFSNIPEKSNRVPDLLDEVRWELEFLLRMIVPKGYAYEGMVHHKVHDVKWTPLPMPPDQDPEERALHRPSTAATLDFAAAAAMGARSFRLYDREFSHRLLDAAETAWSAAASNPAVYAPKSDGLQGGGDYDDDDVSGEFFWAAAELFITTGQPAYLSALKGSPHWSRPVLPPSGAIDWRDVAGLGYLDLASLESGLPSTDRQAARAVIISAASGIVDAQETQAFGQTYLPKDLKYGWASNHLMLQNMVVVAAAYDLTGNNKYLNSVREGMDYILGRNAMNLSYVTGYGSAWARNLHSRWFAHQLNSGLPAPPKGSLAGGPNSTLIDEFSRAHLEGCVSQTCYIDDIRAYGSNEMTIGWNAALVYVSSFLSDTR